MPSDASLRTADAPDRTGRAGALPRGCSRWSLALRWLFVLFVIVEQVSTPWHVFQRDSCVDMDWFSHLRLPVPGDTNTYFDDANDTQMTGVTASVMGRATLADVAQGPGDAVPVAPPALRAREPDPGPGLLLRLSAGGARAPPAAFCCPPLPARAPPRHA